jgi:hypothetical protein
MRRIPTYCAHPTWLKYHDIPMTSFQSGHNIKFLTLPNYGTKFCRELSYVHLLYLVDLKRIRHIKLCVTHKLKVLLCSPQSWEIKIPSSNLSSLMIHMMYVNEFKTLSTLNYYDLNKLITTQNIVNCMFEGTKDKNNTRHQSSEI